MIDCREHEESTTMGEGEREGGRREEEEWGETERERQTDRDREITETDRQRQRDNTRTKELAHTNPYIIRFQPTEICCLIKSLHSVPVGEESGAFCEIHNMQTVLGKGRQSIKVGNDR